MKIFKLIVSTIIFLSLYNCSNSNYNKTKVKKMNVESSGNEHIISFAKFNGDAPSFFLPSINNSKKLNVFINSNSRKSIVYFGLFDADMNKIWQVNAENINSVKGSVDINPEEKYIIRLRGENAKGDVRISWN